MKTRDFILNCLPLGMWVVSDSKRLAMTDLQLYIHIICRLAYNLGGLALLVGGHS